MAKGFVTQRNGKTSPAEIPAGVIGLGLMGHSIIACLLAAGHSVTAVTRSLARHRDSRRRISALLRELRKQGLTRRDPAKLMDRLRISETISDLEDCGIVVESIIEDLDTKKRLYREVEDVIGRGAIIGSNTSAIPVSVLQRDAVCPGRFVGIHWDEPAHITRFMEVIAGEQTEKRYARRVMALAEAWGKEPSLLRRDVRGFITNRVSYAMFREACWLVDAGIATFEDVDRSLRNDVGWWIPFAGPFRYMDLMGIESYHRVMQELLPELSTCPNVPESMRRVIESGGRGVSNGRGFYRYTPEEAKEWQERFIKFNYDVRRLAMKYPASGAKAQGKRSRPKPGGVPR
jgi:3-hydroxybutyryl-CoA dehydrogenase